MRKKALAATLFAICLILGLGSSEMIRAQAPAYVTKQILKTDLQNLPGREVLLFVSEWQPGFRLPWHLHPNGHEFTYVIEGEQTFEIEGVGTKIVKAGEVLYTRRIPHITDAMLLTGRRRHSLSASKMSNKPVMTEVTR
jgi:quercetin dioxygenase-like cupin family protein